MERTIIYHNPNCSTSCHTLALIRQAGIEPTIIEYLSAPPSREKLQQLITQMCLPVRNLLRSKEKIYAELNLDNPALSDEELIDAMITHPILIARPIVETPSGTRLCRPAEAVAEIL